MIVEPINEYKRDPNVICYMVDDEVEMLLHPDWDFPMFVRPNDGMITIPEEADIHRLEEQHPWLNAASGEVLSKVLAAYYFLRLCEKRTSLNRDFTTTRIKNHAEDLSNVNICDACFLRAALLAGFAVEPVDGCGRFQMNIVTDARYFDLVENEKRARRTVRTRLKQERLEEWKKEAHKNDHLWRQADYPLSRFERAVVEFAAEATLCGRREV